MSDVLHVTGCRVFLNQSEDERLKGFASIILNDEFAVCDLKIINGNKGLFVAMPSRRRRDGSFHDVAHPIVSTLREHIESVVLGFLGSLVGALVGHLAMLLMSMVKSGSDVGVCLGKGKGHAVSHTQILAPPLREPEGREFAAVPFLYPPAPSRLRAARKATEPARIRYPSTSRWPRAGVM